MENEIKYIETKTAKYPLVFNINVVEIIQEKYGDLNKWSDLIEGNIRDKKGKVIQRVIPSLKDIKFFIKEAINEGIDIENENNKEKRNFVTEKQTGRILTEFGTSEMIKKIKEVTIESAKTDKQIEEEKNV